MFNNIIYFIIALLIFNVSNPEKNTSHSVVSLLTLLPVFWVSFAWYCSIEFRRLLKKSEAGKSAFTQLSAPYQRIIARMSVLALLLFAVNVHVLDVKYWFQKIPLFSHLSVLQGIAALLLFFFYLSTIWYYAYPAYKLAFGSEIARKSYLLSNIRLNLPILLPWIFISLIYDLAVLTSMFGHDGVAGSMEGQILFFSVLLLFLAIFLPALIRYIWGCKPLDSDYKVRAIESFLSEKRFRYAQLLNWPIFEGRTMTAGIMGIVPRYRYLLVTDSLLNFLSIDQLKAVIAHEMGHAKYYHLIFYLVFFIGFMLVSFGLFDFSIYLLYAYPWFTDAALSLKDTGLSLLNLAISVPVLITLVVYFRYVMGFFMRHFERQADLYSAQIMGTPEHTINSLEKIASLSGKIRDLPSWHHFSIKERVDCLWNTLKNPEIIKRHNFLIAFAFLIYLISLIGLAYFLNFSTTKQSLNYSLAEKAITLRLVRDPGNMELHQNLALLYHETGKLKEAALEYERVIKLNPRNATALNNLSWLLVTAENVDLRDMTRALELAEKAVGIERSAVFLDTLAEALFANGRAKEAVNVIEEAIAKADKNKGYYISQREKFLASMK